MVSSASCGTAPWPWTSGYRWLVLDFDKEVIYYSSTASGEALCKPKGFSEFQLTKSAPAAEQSRGSAICQPQFRVPLQFGRWKASLVALSVTEHYNVSQLLFAACGRERHLSRSLSSSSTMASSTSLQEGCKTPIAAPEVCWWKLPKGGEQRREACVIYNGAEGRQFQVFSLAGDAKTWDLEEEYDANWLCRKAALHMNVQERVRADLNLANRKVCMLKPSRRGHLNAIHMSPEERRRADLKLVGL